MIRGLHHITTVAGSAQGNLDFYTGVLGLDLVKRTVHFNNPNVYHLYYYGNQTGSPGSLLSFFLLPAVLRGRHGARQVNEVGLAVPQDSLGNWLDRLKTHQISHHPVAEKFGEPYLTLYDPDGLKLELTAVNTSPDKEIRPEINGLYQVTIATENL
jgi:glyoxalase family protein